MINKIIIEENFSKHAGNYDQHSKVQNFSASMLIKKIKGESFSKILDIGCGTYPFFLLNTEFNKKYGMDPSLKIDKYDENIILKTSGIKNGERLFLMIIL